MLLVAASALAVCFAQDGNVSFRQGTEWRAQEKASLEQDAQMHGWKRPTHLGRPFLYPPDRPRFRASWTNEVVREVCLSTGNRGGVFELRVFDGQGRLIEDNLVKTERGWLPARLVSISPIRIAFGGTNSADAEVVGTVYTKEQASEIIAKEDREYEAMVQKVVDDTFRGVGTRTKTNRSNAK